MSQYVSQVLEYLESRLTAEPRNLIIGFWDLETALGGEPIQLVADAIAGLRVGALKDEATARAGLSIIDAVCSRASDPALRFLIFATATTYCQLPGNHFVRMHLFSCAKQEACADDLVFAKLRTAAAQNASVLSAIEDSYKHMFWRCLRIGELEWGEKLLRQSALGDTELPKMQFEFDLLSGNHLVLASVAADQTASSSEFYAQWINFILTLDYRHLRIMRKEGASAGDRARLWLCATLSGRASDAKGVASPNYVRKVFGASGNDQDRIMIKIATELEKLVELVPDSTHSEVAREIGLAVTAAIAEIERPLDAILTLKTAESLARQSKNPPLAATFVSQLEHLCLTATKGRSRDPFLLESDIINSSSSQLITPEHVQATPIPRGARRGAATGKELLFMLSRATLHNLRQRFTFEQESKKQLYTHFLAELKTQLKDLSTLRGPVQKVLQLGSVASNILPYELRDGFEIGRSESHSMSREEIETRLTAAFGDWSSIFAEFSFLPLACGSIGQVHVATLRQNHQRVCVKVRYPNIEQIVRSDFRVLRLVAKIAATMFPLKNSKAILDAWEKTVIRECDLAQEAKDHAQFRSTLAGSEIKVPQVWTELSSPDILVTEFIDGQTISEFIATSTQAQRNSIGIAIWRGQYEAQKRGLFRYDTQESNFVIKDDEVWFIDLAHTQSCIAAGFDSHLGYMHDIAAGREEDVARRLLSEGWTNDSHKAERAAKIAVQVFGRPFRGTFRFDEGFVKEAMDCMLYRVSKEVSPPKGAENMVRIFWGIWSILARLNATADWRSELAPVLAI